MERAWLRQFILHGIARMFTKLPSSELSDIISATIFNDGPWKQGTISAGKTHCSIRLAGRRSLIASSKSPLLTNHRLMAGYSPSLNQTPYFSDVKSGKHLAEWMNVSMNQVV